MNSLTHQGRKFNCSNQDWARRTASRRYRAWQEMEAIDSDFAVGYKASYDEFMSQYAVQHEHETGKIGTSVYAGGAG